MKMHPYYYRPVDVSSYLVPLVDASPVLNVLNRRSHSADRECFYIVVLLSVVVCSKESF
jgi:hypothetical protein